MSADELSCLTGPHPGVTVGLWVDAMRRILARCVPEHAVPGIRVCEHDDPHQPIELPRTRPLGLGDLVGVEAPGSQRWPWFSVSLVDEINVPVEAPLCGGEWVVYGETLVGRSVEDSLMVVVGLTALAQVTGGSVLNFMYFEGLTPELAPPDVWEDLIVAEAGGRPDLNASAQLWHDRVSGAISRRMVIEP